MARLIYFAIASLDGYGEDGQGTSIGLRPMMRCWPPSTCTGAERGSVTDIYLPRWFAHNLPAIHVPLIVIAGYLHTRNLRDAT